jgi:head-tail adaptor
VTSGELFGYWEYRVERVEAADQSVLASQGEELLVIGTMEDGIHVNAFDSGGRRVRDWREADSYARSEGLASLKLKLTQYAETPELSRAEQDELIATVEAVSSHTRGWIRGRYTEGVTNTVRLVASQLNVAPNDLPDLSNQMLEWRTSSPASLFDSPAITYGYLVVVDENRRLVWILSAGGR